MTKVLRVRLHDLCIGDRFRFPHGRRTHVLLGIEGIAAEVMEEWEADDV